MGMNPAALIKLHHMFKKFEERHPGVVNFTTKELMRDEIPEGSIFELSLTRPGEKSVATNMRLTKEDIEMLKALQELR